MSKKALNLYDLSILIRDIFTIHSARSLNTHRYTATELAEYLQKKTKHKITPMRVGLAMQALGHRWWQDGSDGCKYFYLTPRKKNNHKDFINPQFINPLNLKSNDRSTISQTC